MGRKTQSKITLEMLETVCTLCQARIHPSEILMTGADSMRCPKCGKDFAPEAKGNWSQLGK
jgi:hypothetical protein